MQDAGLFQICWNLNILQTLSMSSYAPRFELSLSGPNHDLLRLLRSPLNNLDNLPQDDQFRHLPALWVLLGTLAELTIELWS